MSMGIKNSRNKDSKHYMPPRRISEPFIIPSGNAVDQFVRRDNYLAPRLFPFFQNSDEN